MALIKNIGLENGVNTNYHRVVSVTNITNTASLIEVASYTSKTKRNEEKKKIAAREPMDIFIKSKHIPLPYDENMNVVAAYEHLKKTEKFSGAKDD